MSYGNFDVLYNLTNVVVVNQSQCLSLFFKQCCCYKHLSEFDFLMCVATLSNCLQELCKEGFINKIIFLAVTISHVNSSLCLRGVEDFRNF